MSSLNKITLIGNVGRDPEMKDFGNDQSVCSFSVATSKKFKDRQGVEKEETEWHNVTAWNRLSKTICNYVKKGDKIYLEGSIKTETWTDNNGEEKSTKKIVAFSVLFLSNKASGQAQQPPPVQRPQPPQSRTVNHARPQPPTAEASLFNPEPVRAVAPQQPQQPTPQQMGAPDDNLPF